MSRNMLAYGDETFDNRIAVGPTNRNNDSGNCFKFRTAGNYKGLWSQYADRNISILNLKKGEQVTFTISNVSMMGIDHFTPILNPPETGILGVGRVAEKPWVHNGALAVRQVMSLSLTFNHMVTDGGPAMKFLRTLADMLEKPVRMLG